MKKEFTFIDEMLEESLFPGGEIVKTGKEICDAFEGVIRAKATIIQDLGRIENAFQVMRKRHPEVLESFFREYIKLTRPEDYEKCVRSFGWKEVTINNNGSAS